MQSQQQMQQQMQQQQQQAQEDRRQMQAIMQQLVSHQSVSNVQHKESSTRSLARSSAGATPTFNGTMDNIEVHRWFNSIGLWFKTAAVAEDRERIDIAVSAFRTGAATWWVAEVNAGRDANYNTWVLFEEVVRRHFLPQNPAYWAREQIKALTSKQHANIIQFSERYNELNQLIATRDEDDRLVDYISGLPDEYRFKAGEMKYKTLAEVVEAALTRYNVRRVTGAKGAPSLHHMETGSDAGSAGSSSYSPGQAASPSRMHGEGPQTMSATDERLERLMAMMTQKFGGGGSNQKQGDSRGRAKEGGANRARSRSGSTMRSFEAWRGDLGLNEADFEHRMTNKLCVSCASKDHISRDCPSRKAKKAAAAAPTN